MKKLLVISIIALFVGLAFIPSFNAVSIAKKDNNPPSKPTIYGPQGGRPGISYTFSFNAVDPDGDNVSYFIKWGDGTSDGWTPYAWSGTNVNIAHTWDKICDYPIRVKAKDIYGKEGNWSDLIIRINRNKPQIVDFNQIDIEEDCGCSDEYNTIKETIDKSGGKLDFIKPYLSNSTLCTIYLILRTRYYFQLIHYQFYCAILVSRGYYKLLDIFLEYIIAPIAAKFFYYEEKLAEYDCGVPPIPL